MATRIKSDDDAGLVLHQSNEDRKACALHLFDLTRHHPEMASPQALAFVRQWQQAALDRWREKQERAKRDFAAMMKARAELERQRTIEANAKLNTARLKIIKLLHKRAEPPPKPPAKKRGYFARLAAILGSSESA